ncbi:MAG: YabP/YqfC family sporulation protein [Lachnospiraceae bacterium]|nr:YabP/YqfC family sporulation protein [Lachnospiraceae bacterium]
MKKFNPQQVEERVSNTFSLPKDVVMGLTNIHLIGNRELIIENYRGILLCSETCIKVQAKKQLLIVEGKELKIVYYTNKDMKISGMISAISFQ